MNPNPISLSFQQLVDEKEQIADQEVLIRGFLYKTDNGQWVLASEPNLRTCCVGSSNHVKKQIFLENSYVGAHPNAELVSIQGILRKDPMKDVQGNLIQYYSLQNVTIIENKGQGHLSYLSLLFPLVVLVIIYLIYLKNKDK